MTAVSVTKSFKLVLSITFDCVDGFAENRYECSPGDMVKNFCRMYFYRNWLQVQLYNGDVDNNLYVEMLPKYDSKVKGLPEVNF